MSDSDADSEPESVEESEHDFDEENEKELEDESEDFLQEIKDEISITIIIPQNERKTSSRLTKYERTLLIGTRAEHIAAGEEPTIPIPPKITDPIEIAKYELENRAIPLIIRRPLPSHNDKSYYEDWMISELTF